DHLALLVGIANPLDDPHFDHICHRFSFAFSILKAISRPFGDSPNGLSDPQAFISSLFQLPCSFLHNSVHALSVNPNT
ncbi:hypothetical protein H5410_003083, partial [Solanum commersonii]